MKRYRIDSYTPGIDYRLEAWDVTGVVELPRG